MPSAGKVVINISAGTSQFIVDMDKANRKLNEFRDTTSRASQATHASVSSTQAASAAIRVFEGNISNNIRAAEKFIATIPGVSAALKAAFPIIGAIALGGVIVELGKKVDELYHAFQKIRTAPLAINEAFGKLNTSVVTSNDELQVTNDKLANEIAKLEGTPQNGLKIALDEARVAADKLAESIDKDLTEVQKLLKDQGIGTLKGLFTGTAATSDIQDQFGGSTGFGGFRQRINELTASGDEEIRKSLALDSQKAAQSKLNASLAAEYGNELAYVNSELAKSKQLQADSAKPSGEVVGPIINGVVVRSGGRPAIADQAARITTLTQLSANLNAELNRFALTAENQDLTKRLDLDRANKANEPKTITDYYGDALAKLNAELSAAKDKASAAGTNLLTEALAKTAGEATSKMQELNKELAKQYEEAVKNKGPRGAQSLSLGQSVEIQSLETQIALSNLIADGKKKVQDASRKSDQEELRAIEDQIKKAQELTEQERKRQEEIAKSVSKINDETQAIGYQITAVAAGGGRQQLRDAQIAGIRAEGRNLGEDPSVTEAKIQKQLSEFQLGDAQSGINQTAQQGLLSWLHQTQDATKSAGQTVTEVLGGAFQGLNSQITNLITGQKTNFSSLFRDIAAQVAQIGLNRLFGQLAGALIPGSRPITGAASSPGAATGNILQTLGGSSDTLGGGIGSVFSAIAPLAASGGGGIGLLTSLFGGFLADGGPLESDKWYIAGEHGPEPVWGGGSNAFAMGYGGGGDTHITTIDARGSQNAAETEMRVKRAIAQAQQQGAADGAKISAERRRRVPNSKAFVT